jgi:FkbM family methyltransferase
LRASTEAGLFRLGLIKRFHIKYPSTSFTIIVDRGPPSFWKLLEKGKWDTNLIEFIVDLVKPGETILDVGAWEGPLSFLFSHQVTETGKVYSFEPMPLQFSTLEHLVKINRIQNIFPYQLAMSNTVGSLVLHSDRPGSTMSTMQDPRKFTSARKASKFNVQINCECTTIDDFCTNKKVEPNGIKIDVEGAEQEVLKGAVKTIEKFRPWCILEFHGQFLSQTERKQTWSFITKRAKKIIYLLGEEAELTPRAEVPSSFQPNKETRALYCIFFGVS